MLRQCDKNEENMLPFLGMSETRNRPEYSSHWEVRWSGVKANDSERLVKWLEHVIKMVRRGAELIQVETHEPTNTVRRTRSDYKWREWQKAKLVEMKLAGSFSWKEIADAVQKKPNQCSSMWHWEKQKLSETNKGNLA